MNEEILDVVVIGAGLTGLATATYLAKEGLNAVVLEKTNRIGGQIRTYSDNGFVFESGPNTGTISNYEVVELFDLLKGKVQLVKACEDSKKRLIWKGDRFYPLPSGLLSAVKTPLFTWHDKFKILFEPFVKKGSNPFESVGELASRRLGKSFLNYAVDPFISGIYAGDPMKLVTKYALPKLYNLEQDYGSFIKGAFKKSMKEKTPQEKATTKEVFSVSGGLSNLISAMSDYLGEENIRTNISNIIITPSNDNKWIIKYENNGSLYSVCANNVVTTTGAHELHNYMPFISSVDMECLQSVRYSPIIQVSVAIDDKNEMFNAFGGLVPSIEKKGILGILFPSKCFVHDKRALDGKILLSVFIGGVRNPEYIDMPDDFIEKLVEDNVCEMMRCDKKDIIILKIFRHRNAIPQYEKNSGDRFVCIDKIEKQYKGLYLKGNMIGGIGMADRIKQAIDTAKIIIGDRK